MSAYFTIDSAGHVHDLPECQVCGAPILRPGVCGPCAEFFQSVEEVTQVSVRVIIPDKVMLQPQDLRE